MVRPTVHRSRLTREFIRISDNNGPKANVHWRRAGTEEPDEVRIRLVLFERWEGVKPHNVDMVPPVRWFREQRLAPRVRDWYLEAIAEHRARRRREGEEAEHVRAELVDHVPEALPHPAVSTTKLQTHIVSAST